MNSTDNDSGNAQDNENDFPAPADGNNCQNGPCGCGVQEPTRRGLLTTFTWLIGGMAAMVTGIPVLGFLAGPLRRQEDQWVDAGEAQAFPVGETRLVRLLNPLRKATDGDTGKVAVYVRHLAESEFQVLSVYCTHLGCPVSWFPEAGLFMCPCHGGAYYEDGARASGPPPRGLYEYDVRVDDGKLLVKLGHLPTLSDPA